MVTLSPPLCARVWSASGSGSAETSNGRHALVAVMDVATRTTVTVEDDLDGSPAEETLRFNWSGADYEIDLSAKNAAKFRTELAPFVEHARAYGGGQRRRSSRPASSRRQSAAIRTWAKQQGVQLNERGRIPDLIVAQYNAAARGSSVAS
jgi:Lsr2